MHAPSRVRAGKAKPADGPPKGRQPRTKTCAADDEPVECASPPCAAAEFAEYCGLAPPAGPGPRVVDSGPKRTRPATRGKRSTSPSGSAS
jgi:hypothetical protein